MEFKENEFDVVVVGGGLGGLTAALHLSKNNLKVCLIEKNTYPHHKVCGEYVSNEILPYLKTLNILPFQHNAKKINRFEISNVQGNIINCDLPLGGFGISRFAFDKILYDELLTSAQVYFDTVLEIQFKNNGFKTITNSGKKFTSVQVIGAFGKRSNLDIQLKRNFISQKSPWLAVKGHYEFNMPDNVVTLHNFDGGYCGLSKTETNVVNACYLTTFSSFRKYRNIQEHQKGTMSKNPYLKDFFQKANPLFSRPITISQISFNKKNLVEDHVLMVGDSAGLIHPLCGNGMAMAIKSAKMVSELILSSDLSKLGEREKMERKYKLLWWREFGPRLRAGRLIQKALTHPINSKIGFNAIKLFPGLLPVIINKTHGSPTV